MQIGYLLDNGVSGGFVGRDEGADDNDARVVESFVD